MHLAQLPARKKQLEKYHSVQRSEPICSILKEYGETNAIYIYANPVTKPCWEVRGLVTIIEDLLSAGGIVVPQTMQAMTLSKLHEGHQQEIHCCCL